MRGGRMHPHGGATDLPDDPNLSGVPSGALVREVHRRLDALRWETQGRVYTIHPDEVSFLMRPDPEPPPEVYRAGTPLRPVPGGMLGTMTDPYRTPDGDPPLLTKSEERVVRLLAEAWNELNAAIPDGPTRDADLFEAGVHVHALQNMVLAQAAARAYPDTYRLLGGSLRSVTWKPGDPCGKCGSTDTHGPTPGCRSCGASDADE